jgi:hypothetical protein
MSDPLSIRIAPDVRLGRDVKLHAFVNLYGCEIGDETKIGTFVEIQKGVKVGRRVKISSHTFICQGVTIEDEVFIGHGVMFINDKYPRATNSDASLKVEAMTCRRTLWWLASLRDGSSAPVSRKGRAHESAVRRSPRAVPGAETTDGRRGPVGVRARCVHHGQRA